MNRRRTNEMAKYSRRDFLKPGAGAVEAGRRAGWGRSAGDARPHEGGVAELDASVMYGPTHTAGAVAALRNIKNPSKVARLVMERTDHVLLVGKGALKFARAHGFKEEDLLTEKSRAAWLRWQETLSVRDNWFPPT